MIRSALPSCDPLSTTMTSTRQAAVFAYKLSRHSSVMLAVFQFTMMTDRSIGLALEVMVSGWGENRRSLRSDSGRAGFATRAYGSSHTQNAPKNLLLID